MEKFILLMIVAASLFNSCTKKQIPTRTKDQSQQVPLAERVNSMEKLNETEEKNLLQKAHDAIRKGNNREGYIALQQFEDKFMTDEAWKDAERFNPRDFASRKEILASAQKAANESQFVKAYMLYRLLLPYL